MSTQHEVHEIALAVAGDRDALRLFAERHGSMLQARLRGEIAAKWQSMLEVDDVLQVTFLEVFLRIDRFEYRGPGSFEAWLTRIARHNLTDAIRSLQQLRQLPPESGSRCKMRQIRHLRCSISWASPAERPVARRSLRIARDGAAAVDQLPSDYARVITLYDLEAKSAEEVAGRCSATAAPYTCCVPGTLDFLRETLGSASQLGP